MRTKKLVPVVSSTKPFLVPRQAGIIDQSKGMTSDLDMSENPGSACRKRNELYWIATPLIPYLEETYCWFGHLREVVIFSPYYKCQRGLIGNSSVHFNPIKSHPVGKIIFEPLILMLNTLKWSPTLQDNIKKILEKLNLYILHFSKL